ncbi:hypothetical protein [Ramlibacter albus]|uniref:Uncharacterized protein n=1 Tax=Ramlibacter albus TaxID=2079448 RepID=A0A923M9R9_9BURK|nr:hypothetical protein [Ramlibacter albus]MBC5765107.1 hypothetical protein [Ramlibacter albus]
MSRTTHNQLRRLVLALLSAAAASVFFGVVAHHVWNGDFQPLAAFCLPIVVPFFGFTSLLFMRGRSLGKSRESLRTLFAAERSMQGTVFYLFGIVVGASLYGLMQYMDLASRGWLLMFLVPYALMQRGLLLFISAVWIIAPQLVHPVSPFTVWRRVAREV